MSSRRENFINWLLSLEANQERATLATLRRGLGEPPGSVLAMGRYVYGFFGIDELETPEGRYESEAFFLIAALFALHPKNVSFGNMGDHLRALKHEKEKKGDKDDATERRFAQLLATHPDDLHEVLPRLVSLLKAKEQQPINWGRLLRDVRQWGNPSGFVQKEWARSFWHKDASKSEPDLETTLISTKGE